MFANKVPAAIEHFARAARSGKFTFQAGRYVRTGRGGGGRGRLAHAPRGDGSAFPCVGGDVRWDGGRKGVCVSRRGGWMVWRRGEGSTCPWVGLLTPSPPGRSRRLALVLVCLRPPSPPFFFFFGCCCCSWCVVFVWLRGGGRRPQSRPGDQFGGGVAHPHDRRPGRPRRAPAAVRLGEEGGLLSGPPARVRACWRRAPAGAARRPPVVARVGPAVAAGHTTEGWVVGRPCDGPEVSPAGGPPLAMWWRGM